VLVFGSRARGDHEEDSDLDLLVVLDRVDNRSAERDFMGDVIWQHTYDSGILVSALPVSRDEFANGKTAFLRTVKAEGVAA
jgi:predicted nucleotidyltransferase